MTFVLFLLYIVSYFLHLTSRVPVLGAVRFDFILGSVLLALLLAQERNRQHPDESEPQRKLTMFLGYVLISLPLVTWPGSVIKLWLVEWLKVLAFFVFSVKTIKSEKQLKIFLWVFISCQILRILEPVYLHLAEGYWGSKAYSINAGRTFILNRLGGAPHDVVNPNQLAWIIVTTFPFLYYLYWRGRMIGKALFLLAMPPFIYCLALTGSRSGILSLAAVVLGIIFFSKNRTRNLLIAVVILLPIAAYVYGNIDSDLQTRYLSLVDSNVAGADTAKGRLNAFHGQIRSIFNNPLFGGGLGSSKEMNWNILGRAQITHNLYLETLQETGVVGFIFFMLYVISIMQCLATAKKLLKKNDRNEEDWLFRLILATQAWLFMDIFYSLSCFGLMSWEWYLFGGISTLCLVFAKGIVCSNINERRYI